MEQGGTAIHPWAKERRRKKNGLSGGGLAASLPRRLLITSRQPALHRETDMARATDGRDPSYGRLQGRLNAVAGGAASRPSLLQSLLRQRLHNRPGRSVWAAVGADLAG